MTTKQLEIKNSPVKTLDFPICTWPICCFIVLHYAITFEVVAEFSGDELGTIVAYDLVRVSEQ